MTAAADRLVMPAADVTLPAPPTRSPTIRVARLEDAVRIHDIITSHLLEGRLLPRPLAEIEAHAEGFFVATDLETIVGCGELAPLGLRVAEVRSLVVEAAYRGSGTGASLLRAIIDRARTRRFGRLCAFTHAPTPFIRMGFSMLPRLWVPEKITADCVTCDRFRHCTQHALRLDLGAAPAAH